VARAAILGRLTWRLARVAETVDETPTTRTLLLEIPDWSGHLPGQHVDVRLTAPDGYSAQRSYSIATAPAERLVGLTIERLEDGEVSPYLTTQVRPGSRFELRGPIGGYFVWDGAAPGAMLLLAGGSGLVPLMSMLRHRATLADRGPAQLVYSARTFDRLIYRAALEELGTGDPGLRVSITLTRQAPPDWDGHTGRVDRKLLEQLLDGSRPATDIFVCGPTAFVEGTAQLLVDFGYPSAVIKTERFGPTGG
jgi:ferredoxin-NADP reductase